VSETFCFCSYVINITVLQIVRLFHHQQHHQLFSGFQVRKWYVQSLDESPSRRFVNFLRSARRQTMEKK
jgi:hypothetical protein